jgi:hypothetical protein
MAERASGGMHFQGLDVLGITVAGSMATSPSWYDHALAYAPTPTTFYTVVGSIFLIVQIYDKVSELIARRRRRQRGDPDSY